MVKFLTVPRLQKVSAMMQAVDVGDRIINARVEAYSCKLAGGDKRTAKEVGSALDASLSHAHAYTPAGTPQTSPLGDLHEPATKNLLVSLITTLNASFQDYDFSNLRPDEFQRETAPQVAVNNINSLFLNAVSSTLPSSPFREEFWSALEETIFLADCEVYRFEPREESDLSEGKLWVCNYFFFNRKLKKMLFLTAEAISKLHLQNVHSAAYQQQLHRRNQQMADEGAHYDGGEDEAEEDAGAIHHAMVNGGDDEMMADDEEMDDGMGHGEVAGEGPAGGAYVDVNLLEWDGLPLEEITERQRIKEEQQHQHSFMSDSSSLYDTSPASTASSSSATNIRVRPLPDAAAASLGAQRLASTRAPVRGGYKSAFSSPGLPPTPAGVSLFGSSHSSGFTSTSATPQ